MARIVQTRDAEFSVFQSAIDEVAVKEKAGGAQSLAEAMTSTTRPGVEDPMVRQAALLVPDVKEMIATKATALTVGPAPTGPVTEGVGGRVKYCAALAFNLAKAKFHGDTELAEQCSKNLSAVTGTCDPRYKEAAEQTVTYFKLLHGVIPYIQWQELGDYVIDDGGKTLGSDAKVAVIGDWGTGQEQAFKVLVSLAKKSPDVVIHLGDVYYSGTDAEEQHYFFDNWCKYLNVPVDATTRRVKSRKPATFGLVGNHDMYTGGAAYYKMIQQLGQRASFFCLRNEQWQFIGLDTGYFDHGLGGPCTHLAPEQAAWLRDKMDNNGDRKTVLLSHHQLFSNQETFDAKDGTEAGATNPLLLAEVAPILPKVNLWLWGHQHEFVAYNDPRVRGRCMGHGGYPVGVTEIEKPGTAIALDTAIAAQQKGKNFWDNGYAIVALNGAGATVTYYAVDENGNERSSASSETI